MANDVQIVRKVKPILLLIVIFFAVLALAFFFENSYRAYVRFLFKLFQGGDIIFVDKDLHLFPGTYFVVSFGIFSVVLTTLLRI